MKKIPYNGYIYFEQLSTLFKEGADRQENVIKCGMASIELSTNLLGGVLQQREKNQSELVTHLLNGIERQLSLLNTYPWDKQMISYQNDHSGNIDHLKLLSQEYSDSIDKISKMYFKLSARFKIGLEDQFNEIRKHFKLTKIDTEKTEQSAKKVLSDVINMLKLDELPYFNNEDKLFMMTHQISECWFNIVINELKTIQEQFQNFNINLHQVEVHFKAAFDILIYLADHILILEHMVLADYHPLRVALRGASGGQSQQAYVIFSLAQKTYAEFLKLLKKNDKQIIEILERPGEYSDLLAIVNYFSKLERSLKNFFFQHYILSSSVIGSQSFGSIGHDLVSLVDKFVEPVFKEIDQVKYDLTLKTNFQYGSTSGILVLEKEKALPTHKQSHLKDQEITDKVIGQYFEAISNLNLEEWVSLFAEDGYIEDPVGSRPYLGRQQLAIFFKGVLRFFSQLSMVIEEKRAEKECTKVSWTALATVYNGNKITFSGEEVFQINSKGKISVAKVYWDPSVIADQL